MHSTPPRSTVPVGQPQTSTPAPESDHAARRKKLLSLRDQDFPDTRAILISDPTDIHYLSGVKEGILALVIWKNGCLGLSRQMLIREVEEMETGIDILLPTSRSTIRPDTPAFILGELRRRGLTSLLIDPAKTDAQSYLDLAKKAARHQVELLVSPQLTAPLRQRKDDAERQLITRCIGIAEKALAGLVENGARSLLGRSERELAHELEARMQALGADRQGFPGTGIIIAGGSNSASAHHSPGERKIASGDSLLIDWGAELSSYRSDMTRTFFVGLVPDFAKKAYPVVKAALESAASLLAPGIPLGKIDEAARKTVTAAGYEEFHYGVGHGFGLDIHECPWIRANAEELFEPDMVTTIEPGIYLAGTGGIRIENNYLLTENGARCLSQFPSSLEEMLLP